MDDCLTTDTLARVYPQEKTLGEKYLSKPEILGRHRLVHIELMEIADNALRGRIKPPLTNGEVLFVCRRIELFLIARGFSVKMTI